MKDSGWTLHILFTGLCGIVPEWPIEDGSENEAWVALVNAMKHPKHQHVGRLIVHRGFIVEKFSRKEAGRIGKGDSFAFFDLYRQEVSVREARRCSLDVVSGLRSEEQVCPQEVDRYDINWSLQTRRLYPEGSMCPGQMDADCLRRPKTAVNGELLSLFHLEQGRLQTYDFARKKNGEIIVWNFGPFRQALADVFLFRWEGIQARQVHLDFYDLESGQVGSPLVLNPAGRNPVVVEVKNMPEADMCPDPEQLRRRAENLDENHLPELYRLLAKPVSDPRSPRPYTTCGPIGHGSLPPNTELNEYTCAAGGHAARKGNGGLRTIGNPQCPGCVFCKP